MIKDSKSRTEKSIRNIAFSLSGYGIKLILQFITRYIFIITLEKEYLGINGLFSSILSMLSLSELGIGAAIAYVMYKPIADENIEKIKSLMHLYKKLYQMIGGFVLVVGLAITPFLQVFIKEMPDIEFIRVFYVLYVIDVGLTYFYSYKKAFIDCNQNEYISTTIGTVCSVLAKTCQVVFLVVTKNFLIYLCIQIIFTRIENVINSRMADKMYPYLKDKDIKKLSFDEKKSIKKNITAMISHKVGTVIVMTTDNLIISKLLGLVSVGLYSNYTLIVDSISALVHRVFAALSASVGNLVALETKERNKVVFNRILFVNFWLYSFCTCCLFNLLQPFIQLWLGTEYLMTDFTVLVISLCFYISGMRNTVHIFRDATGTFFQDRFKPIIECIVNIVVSIPLTYILGVSGVKLGTLISTITVSFWIEAFVLFKYYFQKGLINYYCSQLLYLCITVFLSGVVFTINFMIDIDGILGFLIKLLISITIPNIIIVLLFRRSENFLFYSKLIKNNMSKLFHKKINR